MLYSSSMAATDPTAEIAQGGARAPATGANTLREFLNRLVLRSQCWCVVSSEDRRGFRVAANNAILFYAVLAGSGSLSTPSEKGIQLQAGDIVAVIDQRAHNFCFGDASVIEDLSFLNSAQYFDSPASFTLGDGEPVNRVLCGRLTVRWPGDLRPSALPSTIVVPAAKNLLNLEALVDAARGKGATSLLSHAASVALIAAMSEHPDCRALFGAQGLRSPIERALEMMEEQPAIGWTVGSLAQKVGIGRSAFAVKFLAEVGVPPIEVLIHLRMKLARKLLTTTDLTISEIAEKAGYRSESAFHKRFTSYFQITPAKARREPLPQS